MSALPESLAVVSCFSSGSEYRKGLHGDPVSWYIFDGWMSALAAVATLQAWETWSACVEGNVPTLEFWWPVKLNFLQLLIAVLLLPAVLFPCWMVRLTLVCFWSGTENICWIVGSVLEKICCVCDNWAPALICRLELNSGKTCVGWLGVTPLSQLCCEWYEWLISRGSFGEVKRAAWMLHAGMLRLLDVFDACWQLSWGYSDIPECVWETCWRCSSGGQGFLKESFLTVWSSSF